MATSWDPAKAMAAIRRGAMKGVVAATELVHDAGTKLIQQGPKSGRIYKRRGVTHRASAPGEAPATDTGGLVQSGRTIYDAPNLTGRVNWSSQHAAPLEFGTEKIEPRPFGRRALDENRKKVEDLIAAGIAEALK
jgi:HK97 gp10 family phage protein